MLVTCISQAAAGDLAVNTESGGPHSTGPCDLMLLPAANLMQAQWGSRQTAGLRLRKTSDCAGRKHQIRIHCAQLGAPIVGDSRHGLTRGPAQDALADSMSPDMRRLLKGRLMLHARKIEVIRPSTLSARRRMESDVAMRTPHSNVSIEVEAPVPQHFAALLQVLGFQSVGDAA